MKYEYIEVLGYAHGRKIGRIIPEKDTPMADTEKMIERTIPLVAVDGFTIAPENVKYPKHIDIVFGDQGKAIAAIRLSDEQFLDLTRLVQEKHGDLKDRPNRNNWTPES